MSHHVTEVTDATFDEVVLKSNLPVVVDFWASWCGPCIALAPIFESFAGKLSGKAVLCKVNVDDHRAIAATYGVRSIPTLILFRNGIEEKRAVGGGEAKQLLESLA